MMYRLISVFSLLSILLVSCSGSTDEALEMRIASYEIEGMVCEMGCGSSLRKGLYATNAVDEVEVEYEEERKQNLIHVHYQSGKTTTVEMLKVIQELNDGQFTAKLIEDNLDESGTRADDNENESASTTFSDDVEGLEANSETFTLPNLTELINSLIH